MVDGMDGACRLPSFAWATGANEKPDCLGIDNGKLEHRAAGLAAGSR